MSDNLANITIQENQWTDIYASSGVTVGTVISVENIGNSDVYLAVQALQPDPDHDAYNVLRREGRPLRNSKNDAGAWAFCQGSDGKIAVRTIG